MRFDEDDELSWPSIVGTGSASGVGSEEDEDYPAATFWLPDPMSRSDWSSGSAADDLRVTPCIIAALVVIVVVILSYEASKYDR